MIWPLAASVVEAAELDGAAAEAEEAIALVAALAGGPYWGLARTNGRREIATAALNIMVLACRGGERTIWGVMS